MTVELFLYRSRFWVIGGLLLLIFFGFIPVANAGLAEEINQIKQIATMLKDITAGITEAALTPLGMSAAFSMWKMMMFRAV